MQVPQGVLLRRGDVFEPQLPVIVKPTNTSNSAGVTLVKQKKDYQAALEMAFAHSDEVLVEQFIELGREVRCGVVVQEGEMFFHQMLQQAMIDLGA